VLHSGSRQVAVYKKDGVHVYDSDGRSAGVIPEGIISDLSVAQYKLEDARGKHQRRGTNYEGIQERTPAWTSFVNAHDFMFDPTDEKPETTSVKVNRNGDGTLTVDAIDGKSYRYGSDRLNLVSVELTKR